MNELVLETSSDVVMTRDGLERLIASELVAYRDACKTMGDEYTDIGAAKAYATYWMTMKSLILTWSWLSRVVIQ